MRITWARQEKDIQPLPLARRRKHPVHSPHPLTIILTLLALLALAHFIAVTHSDSAVQPETTDPCNALIHHTDYTKIISLRPPQEMEAVQFIDAILGGQPGALLQVDHNDKQQKTDIYVYSCNVKNHKPLLQLLLKQQGLVQGTVDITQAHTLSIGQLDTALSPDRDTLLLPLQQNIYREYAWQDGTLRQISFPGLYPVTSRSEAEDLQSEAQNGPMVPWNDPLSTAEQMAQDLLHWPEHTFRGTLQDANITDAHVLLEQQESHLQVLVSLARLIRHDSQGLWFVTAAQTPGITLDQTQFAHPQPSPIALQGSIIPTPNSIKATLYDHTLNPIHTLQNSILTTDANGTFSGSMAYSNILPNQAGLILIEEIPPKASSEEGHLLLTNIMLN